MNAPRDPAQDVADTPEAPMSLAETMGNVLAAPGEAFENVRKTPYQASRWVMPAVLLILVSWVCSWFVIQQPAFEQQVREMATKALDQQFEKKQIPEAQQEQAREIAEKWGLMFGKIGAVAAPVFIGFGVPFIWGLVLWLVGTKVFKADFSYMKAVEVNGLANVILILDTIARTLLFFVTGSIFAAVGPSALVKDFDPQTLSHGLLAMINLMAFWFLAVRAVGLAKLSRASFAKSAAWVFGLWFLYHGGTMLLGFGARALAGQ